MGSQKSNKEDNFNMFVSGKKKQEINVETDMDSFHHPRILLSMGNPVEAYETVTLQGVTVFYCVAFGDFSPLCWVSVAPSIKWRFQCVDHII